MAKIWQKSVSSSHKIFIDWPSGLKDASQKADFERDHMIPHSCCIKTKGGAKALDWCYIGENWRKLAEVG